jgi:hypothetical protein
MPQAVSGVTHRPSIATVQVRGASIAAGCGESVVQRSRSARSLALIKGFSR